MNEVKKLVLERRFKIKKSFSQNFLCSDFWAEHLVHWVLQSKSNEVWEIGAGLGALTQKLLKASRIPVRVFEFDRTLCEYLREKFKDIELVEGDFLKHDLTAFLPKFGSQVAILSNLPYHIASPIFFKLLPYRGSISRLVLTFQKEFADRLIARPRTKAYGALSIMAQTFFKIGNMGRLPPQVFYPQPNVSSQALLLEPLLSDDLPEMESLSELVKTAFLHRRKKLIKNLMRVYPNDLVKNIFQELILNEDARAEELPLETYHRLVSFITKSSL